MRNKRVVITGGAGFIGSHLAAKLSRDNEVIVIDDLSAGSLKNLSSCVEQKNLKFVCGSVLDSELLDQYFKEIDFVFHEAALTSVLKSIDDPLSTNQTNIQGTLQILLAAKNHRVKKVIFASSSAVYGDTGTIAKNEQQLLSLESPYALTKIAGEEYCRLFSRLYRLPTACLRYFNVFGPRQNADSAYAAAIPSFIAHVSRQQPPVIFGDGEQTRDFIYVKDVVRANIMVADSQATGVFNIGSGNKISINSLASVILRILGQDYKPIFQPARAGEIRDSQADINAARVFGWQPEYSLESGLIETIKSIAG